MSTSSSNLDLFKLKVNFFSSKITDEEQQFKLLEIEKNNEILVEEIYNL